jgi:hypothetical protein
MKGSEQKPKYLVLGHVLNLVTKHLGTQLENKDKKKKRLRK